MIEVGIIADDLTGAADAGAAFAAAGFSTAILFGHEPGTDVEVVIRSTETRECGAETAVARTAAATETLVAGPGGRPGILYKKIDSALRGHPCEELVATMSASGCRRAVVAPALPAQGRTTRDGRVFVHGELLAGTHLGQGAGISDLTSVFACPGGPPVRHIGLDVVRRGSAAIATLLTQREEGIWLADAETDEDLRAIVEGAVESDVKLLAGSAGLAGQIARSLRPPSCRLAAAVRPSAPVRPVLVVAGSRHVATAAQVEVLAAAGVPVATPDQTQLACGNSSARTIVDTLCTALEDHGVAVLSTVGMSEVTIDAERVSGMLAEVVLAASRRVSPAGLVLTGGDVAAAVINLLGASRISLAGEVSPAVPWGVLRSAHLADIPVVTKAGSFGPPDTLHRCVAFLQHQEG